MKQAFIYFFQTEIIVIFKVIILVIKEVFRKKKSVMTQLRFAFVGSTKSIV